MNRYENYFIHLIVCLKSVTGDAIFHLCFPFLKKLARNHLIQESELFRTSTPQIEHSDTCALESVSKEASIAVASVRSVCVRASRIFATLVVLLLTFVNI